MTLTKQVTQQQAEDMQHALGTYDVIVAGKKCTVVMGFSEIGIKRWLVKKRDSMD